MKASEWYEQALLERQSTPEFQTERLLLEIGEELVSHLESQGMTQAELARRLNVSPPFVSRLLSGNPNLTLKTLGRIAHALGVRVSVFLDAESAMSFRSHTKKLERSEPPTLPEEIPDEIPLAA